MKKKFILVSSLFFSMSINEVFSGNLCYPTNSFYNSSSVNAQSICIVPQNTNVYNEESEFEIPTISTKGLEWKTPNISELRNRTRICNIIETKDDNISATICYPNQSVERILEAIKGAIIELPQDFINNYLPTIIEQMNDLKSRISVVYEQERKFAKKLLAITSIPSKLFQGTSYCVSRVKDFAVSIYQNMKSFITNSVTSLRQKIN